MIETAILIVIIGMIPITIVGMASMLVSKRRKAAREIDQQFEIVVEGLRCSLVLLYQQFGAELVLAYDRLSLRSILDADDETVADIIYTAMLVARETQGSPDDMMDRLIGLAAAGEFGTPTVIGPAVD